MISYCFALFWEGECAPEGVFINSSLKPPHLDSLLETKLKKKHKQVDFLKEQNTSISKYQVMKAIPTQLLLIYKLKVKF